MAPIQLTHLQDLIDKYQETRKKNDLDELIEYTEKVIASLNEDDPTRPKQVIALASWTGQLYQFDGEITHIDQSIDITRDALQSAVLDDICRAEAQGNLALHLVDRFDITRQQADIEEAIKLTRGTLKVVPEDDPDRDSWLGNLGKQLSRRYLYTSDVSALEEAISFSRQSVDAVSDCSPNKGLWLSNLGNRLHERFWQYGEIKDIEEAIVCLRKSLELTPEDHGERPMRLANLAGKLSERFSRLGKREDLDQAIDLTRQAVECTGEKVPWRRAWCHNLGLELSKKYRITGATTKDLDEAIACLREAVKATPEEHASVNQWLNLLSILIGRRFLRFGSMADTEKAVNAARQAVENTEKGDRDYRVYLTTLGNRLRDGFTRTHSLEDLNEAISVTKQAIDATPEGHTDLPTLWHNLSTQLSARHSLDKDDQDDQDIVDAVEYAQKAVDACPDDHSNRPQWLSNLGYQRSVLTEQYMNDAYLSESISWPKRIATQFIIDRGLKKAIKETRMAVEATTAQSPERAMMMIHLGDRLNTRYTFRKDPKDFEEASRYWASAMEFENAPVRIRLMAADRRLSAVNLLDDLERAYEIADATVALMPRLAPNSLSSTDKQQVLEQVVGLAPKAAAIALMAGKGAACAIKILGTSRGILASSLQDLRWNLSLVDLELQHPELAELYHHLRTLLDNPAPDNELVSLLGKDVPQNTDERFEAAEQMETLPDKIRTKPGFERFLAFPSEQELLEAAAEGPVAILNFSSYRCDALIIDSRGMRCREKPFTVESIFETNLSERMLFLAYLSACGTTQNQHDKSIDENVHLTSAFGLAGFRHVIGTLWAVEDALCVRMAGLTYKFLKTHGMGDDNVSRALHFATRELRDDAVGKKKDDTNDLGPGPSGLENERGVDGSGERQPAGDEERENSREGELRDKRKATFKKPGGSSAKVRAPSVHWVPYVHYGS
ncbi:CHAT domain-containing protein [Fusarium sp. LHS14.1]|nr:CHAT domain-containing protein [Fusarium sp. LHS14.1]